MQDLKELERLLDSIGILTTGNINKNYSAGRHRKDGAFTANYRIFIYKFGSLLLVCLVKLQGVENMNSQRERERERE